MTRPKKPTKRKSKPRETSDRVSGVAAKLLAWRKAGTRFYVADHIAPWRDITWMIDAVAGSTMSQDQTKGKRK